MRSNIDILKDRINALEVIAFKIVRKQDNDELDYLKEEVEAIAKLIGHITGDYFDPIAEEERIIDQANALKRKLQIEEEIGTHIIKE